MIISLAGYDFRDTKACLACRHIMDNDPPLLFYHDDDGDIHVACGREDHREEDWTVIDIEDIVVNHPDLYTLPTVRAGEVAERRAPGHEWMVTKAE